MKEGVLLSALPTGKSAKVTKITAGGKLKRRFADLGIIEGSQISAIQRGLSGDPTAYNIRGTVIALRKEDSDKIIII